MKATSESNNRKQNIKSTHENKNQTHKQNLKANRESNKCKQQL